jgi:CheY-like chemotaxis protein
MRTPSVISNLHYPEQYVIDKPGISPILIADDDPDDRLLMRDAFHESLLWDNVCFVEDGEELLDYLYRRGNYRDPEAAPWPGIIILDLNMPRKDGREAIREIKADPNLKRIPLVVLTTSQAEHDILYSYGLGVSSFIVKPVTFTALVEVTRLIGQYWFGVIELPPAPGRSI